MKLHEILTDANLLVPNSLNDDIKVRWLNQDQRQLYRDFGFPDRIYEFPVLNGVDMYPLPNDCSRERITSIILDGISYEYTTIDYPEVLNSWTIIENSVRFYPKPTKNMAAVMNYRPRPADMTVTMQDESPEFPEDFHEILALGIGVRVARSQQDTNKAMELKNAYDLLVVEAKKSLRPSRAKRVKTSRRWS